MAGESAREVAKRSRERAERLQRRAELFERGAEGEERTAAALAALPAEWSVLHDLRWPGRRFANIDHVVVGPGGAFVVDSKNWSGKLTVARDVLRQNGRSRETAVAGCADSALAVSELVGPHAAHVVPVLCFSSEESLTGWVRDVMVCTTDNLAEMLTSRPRRLSPEQVADARARLVEHLPVATSTRNRVPPAATVAADPARRRTTARTPSRSSTGARNVHGKTSTRMSLLRPVMGLVLMLGLLVAAPQVGPVIAGLITSRVTSVDDAPPCVPTAAPTASSRAKSSGSPDC